MTVKITRTEHDARSLRLLSSQEKSGEKLRRLLGLALILDGVDRESAARQCGMQRQTLRDWVHRYNAEGIAGLSDRAHGGGVKRFLSASQDAAIVEWVKAGPDLKQDGVVRWRRADLGQRIAREFDIKLHERSVGKLLHRLGMAHVSTRPRHPKADVEAQLAHKKTLPAW